MLKLVRNNTTDNSLFETRGVPVRIRPLDNVSFALADESRGMAPHVLKQRGTLDFIPDELQTMTALVQVVSFRREYSIDESEFLLEEIGLRHATAAEQLGFWYAHPFKLLERPVYALGSTVSVPGHQPCYLTITWHGKRRSMGFSPMPYVGSGESGLSYLVTALPAR